MPEPKKIPRQPLPDAPRGADHRPIGTRCRPGCRRPVDNTNHCHCSVCHATFRSIGIYDRHRQDGWCLNLPALGLVEEGGLWATPEGLAAADRARDMLAARRAQATEQGALFPADAESAA